MNLDLPDLFFKQNMAAGSSTRYESVGQLITLVLKNAIMLSGVIFFLMILIGGLGMITSAGSSPNPQSAAKAKAAVTYGVIGFLLVVSSYFILQMVTALTGVNFMQPGF